MNRPDFAFVSPVWKTLTPTELRVLLALAMAQPNRVTNVSILSAYQPLKVWTDGVATEIVKRIQPAAASFGLVIVREGKGFRMVERPKEARRAPVQAPAPVEPVTPPAPVEPPVAAVVPKPVKLRPTAKPKPEPEPEPEPTVDPGSLTVEDRIRDLAQRRFGRAAIAATLRVPYRTVERVLG